MIYKFFTKIDDIHRKAVMEIKMGISSIDLSSLVSNAYYCKKNFSYNQYVDLVVDLLYQGFCNMDLFGDSVLSKYSHVSKYPAFTLCHNFITIFIYEDNRLFENEYEVYKKWCERCGHNYFTIQELGDHRKKLDDRDFKGLSALLRQMRGCIDSGYYQNFVYGIVLLSLLNDGQFSEYTYNGLSWILDSNLDNLTTYSRLMSTVYKW